MNHTNNSGTISNSPVMLTQPEVKIALYFVVFFLGLFGNALVVAVVAGKRSTRSFHDIFILNLAISDLVLIVVYFPMFFGYTIGQFRATKIFCQLIWPLITVGYLSSIFNITSMAVHRCRVIVNPYASSMSQRTIYIWIAVLWIVSFSCLIPAMVYAEVVPHNGMCYDAWPSLQIKKAFTLFMVVIQYFLPLSIIAIAYVRIGLELKGPKARKLSRQSRTLSTTRRRENSQVVRTIASIVIVFAVCMFPKHLTRLYYYFGKNSPQTRAKVHKMLIFSEIFAILHSCLNPLVYGTVMKHFRAEYMRYLNIIFCCRWSSSLRRIDFTRGYASNSVDSASGERSNRTITSEADIYPLNTTEMPATPGLELVDVQPAETGIIDHCAEEQGRNTASKVHTKL